MWFKKGELDQAAAEAAAKAPEGELVSSKADTLPEDERYKDDGSITTEDQHRLSLRTGHTQMMSAVDESKLGKNKSGGTAVSDEEIAREMTGGNRNLLIAGGVLALIILIVVIVVVAG